MHTAWVNPLNPGPFRTPTNPESLGCKPHHWQVGDRVRPCLDYLIIRTDTSGTKRKELVLPVARQSIERSIMQTACMGVSGSNAPEVFAIEQRQYRELGGRSDDDNLDSRRTAVAGMLQDTESQQ
jgi:hypothetical protein